MHVFFRLVCSGQITGRSRQNPLQYSNTHTHTHTHSQSCSLPDYIHTLFYTYPYSLIVECTQISTHACHPLLYSQIDPYVMLSTYTHTHTHYTHTHRHIIHTHIIHTHRHIIHTRDGHY